MNSMRLSGAAHLRGVSFIALAAALAASPALADVAADAGPQVEQVVVTATKRPEISKDVPIALSAFSEKDLAARQPRDIVDLAAALPNVSLTTSGPTLFIDPVIRGISSSPLNAGVESGLAVYVDGVYTGRAETFSTALEDSRGVEVLRGPQGTLFGKNAIAGAISIVTEDPTPDFGGRVTLQTGSENEFRASTVLNAPLGDKAGVRLTLFREQRDGYVKNLFDGATLGNDNYWGGRLKTKVELAPSLDLVLAADGRWDDRHPYFGETIDGADPISRQTPQPIIAPGPFTLNEDHKPNKETRNLWGLSATLTYRMANGFTLSSISGDRHARHHFTTDDDSSPADAVFNDFFDQQSQFTQEFRLVSPDSGRLKYAAGLFYFWQNSDTHHVGGLGKDFAIPGVVPGGIVKTVTPAGTIQTRSYAAYVDGSYRLTETLELLAGARVTQENKSATFSVTPEPGIAPLFFAIPLQSDHRNETDVSPTLGLRYKPNEALTGYLRVSRGYKSGGWNLDFISRTPNPAPTLPQLTFQPESVTNYEVGLKGALLDRRLTFDLAAFDMDYRNLQVRQFFGLSGGAVTSNAASATIKGVEGDVSAAITQALTVSATFGFNNARYDSFPSADAAGDSASGKRLPGPRTTASLNAAYAFSLPGAPGAFTAFAEYSWRGEGFATPLNEPLFTVPGRSLTNARLSWSVEQWTATAFVENLFNKTYIDTSQNDPFAARPEALVSFGRPRTVGLRVSKAF